MGDTERASRGGAVVSRFLGKRGDWLPSAAIGVVPLTNFNPSTGKTQRVGTEQFYLADYPACLKITGFTMKPAFRQYLEQRRNGGAD